MCNRNRNDRIGRLDECRSRLRQLVDKHFCWISGWRLTEKNVDVNTKLKSECQSPLMSRNDIKACDRFPYIIGWLVVMIVLLNCVALSFLMFRYAQRWVESFSSSQRACQNTIQTGNARTTTCKYFLFLIAEDYSVQSFSLNWFFKLDSVSWKLVYICSSKAGGSSRLSFSMCDTNKGKCCV